MLCCCFVQFVACARWFCREKKKRANCRPRPPASSPTFLDYHTFHHCHFSHCALRLLVQATYFSIAIYSLFLWPVMSYHFFSVFELAFLFSPLSPFRFLLSAGQTNRHPYTYCFSHSIAPLAPDGRQSPRANHAWAGLSQLGESCAGLG